MGGEQSSSTVFSKEKVMNTHPFQQESIMVEQANRRYIQSSFKVPEVIYDTWKSNVERVSGNPHSQFAYLPVDMGYVPNKGGCGSSDNGYAVVNYH